MSSTAIKERWIGPPSQTLPAALDALVAMDTSSPGYPELVRSVLAILGRHRVVRWAVVTESQDAGRPRVVMMAGSPGARILSGLVNGEEDGSPHSWESLPVGDHGQLVFAPGQAAALARRHVLPMAQKILTLRRAQDTHVDGAGGRQTALIEAMRPVDPAATPVDLLGGCLRAAAQVLPLDAAAMLLSEGDGVVVGVLPRAPTTPGALEEIGRALATAHHAGQDPAGEVSVHLLDPTVSGPERPRLAARSELSAPVRLASGAQVARLCIVSARDEAYTLEDQSIFSSLAAQVGLLLENRNRWRALEREAKVDPMTDLFNHRSFRRLLTAEFSRSRRYHKPLSLILLDIDHFKQVNDTEGHQRGDAVLRDVANILKDTKRREDVVARYGGEEFVVVLPETGLDGAVFVAERIRSRVAQTPILTDRPLTVSLGVACFDGQQTLTDEALIFEADQALYAAKRSGRNKVVTA